MNPIPTPGIPEYIQASADDMMQRVLDGKIRKHLLNDNSAVYTQYEDVVAEFTEQGIKNKKPSPVRFFSRETGKVCPDGRFGAK